MMTIADPDFHHPPCVAVTRCLPRALKAAANAQASTSASLYDLEQISTFFLPSSTTNLPTRAKMSDPVKEQIAQEKFGKSYDELESIEKVAVGGTKGGQARKEQMASEHGGDASAGYSEMGHQGGSKGGEARKEQLAEEHGGDASAGYSEMGQKGGQA